MALDEGAVSVTVPRMLNIPHHRIISDCLAQPRVQLKHQSQRVAL